jgi:hypothetical protein
VIKLPTFGIHTAQRKNVRRDFFLGTRRVFRRICGARQALSKERPVKLLSIAAAFLIATSIARAGLHWTLQECEKQYGPPITGEWTDELGRAVFALNRRGYSNYAYLLDGSGIWSKPPSAEFYKRRAAIAAMAFRYAKHHPGIDYRMAAIVGVGVNDTYPTITVTALDIATYIQKRDPSIPWNVCVTAGAYMETWVDYSRQGFDALAASEILSQGVSKGLKGKVE